MKRILVLFFVLFLPGVLSAAEWDQPDTGKTLTSLLEKEGFDGVLEAYRAKKFSDDLFDCAVDEIVFKNRKNEEINFGQMLDMLAARNNLIARQMQAKFWLRGRKKKLCSLICSAVDQDGLEGLVKNYYSEDLPEEIFDVNPFTECSFPSGKSLGNLIDEGCAQKNKAACELRDGFEWVSCKAALLGEEQAELVKILQKAIDNKGMQGIIDFFDKGKIKGEIFSINLALVDFKVDGKIVNAWKYLWTISCEQYPSIEEVRIKFILCGRRRNLLELVTKAANHKNPKVIADLTKKFPRLLEAIYPFTEIVLEDGQSLGCYIDSCDPHDPDVEAIKNFYGEKWEINRDYELLVQCLYKQELTPEVRLVVKKRAKHKGFQGICEKIKLIPAKKDLDRLVAILKKGAITDEAIEILHKRKENPLFSELLEGLKEAAEGRVAELENSFPFSDEQEVNETKKLLDRLEIAGITESFPQFSALYSPPAMVIEDPPLPNPGGGNHNNQPNSPRKPQKSSWLSLNNLLFYGISLYATYYAYTLYQSNQQRDIKADERPEIRV